MTKKVLVVDDNKQDLRLMKRLLEKAAYKVVAMTDGAKALATVQKQNFDLFLLDIVMPTLSGYDLSRFMRKKLKKKVPLIFVSMIPKNKVRMKNIDGFIQKPFRSKNFLAEINKVWRQCK